MTDPVYDGVLWSSGNPPAPTPPNQIYNGALWSGSIWFSGISSPEQSLGVNGDFYLKTSTAEIFKKQLGSWTVLVDLTGDQGIPGPTGQGVPPGGSIGQFVVKASNNPLDTIWRSLNSNDIQTALGFTPLSAESDTLNSVTSRDNSTSFGIHITDPTNSISVDTGALIVDGGVGISGSTYGAAFYGTFYGNLTGNVTGNVTGNLIGNVTGNASTVTNGLYSSVVYNDPSWLNITANKVGLGNVTNESKSTMFTNTVLTGVPTAPTASAGTNTTQIATTQFVSTAVSNLINGASSALDTLNELSAALNNDASFSTTITNALALKAPLANPTFTGTVSGITAAMVGLGNVTNESKTVMFSSPTFTGTTTLQQSTVIVNNFTGSTGTVIHNFSNGNVFYHASIAGNFTANFTNVPTTNNRAIVITLVLSQGSTGYIPNAVQINSVATTLNWLNGTPPTPTANKIEVVSFSLIRVSSSWVVTGSLSSYG